MNWVLLSSDEDEAIAAIAGHLVNTDRFTPHHALQQDTDYNLLYVAHGTSTSGTPQALVDTGLDKLIPRATTVFGLSCYSYFYLRSRDIPCYVGFDCAPWYPLTTDFCVLKCWSALYAGLGQAITSSHHLTGDTLTAIDAEYCRAIDHLDTLPPSVDSLFSAMVLSAQRTALVGKCQYNAASFGRADPS